MIPLLLINFNSACQTTQKQDSVCLSVEEARIIFKDLQLFEVCDSIRSNQSLQIIHYKSVVANDNQQILLISSRLDKKEKELSKAIKMLQISKKLTFFGVPIAFGGGLILGLLLWNYNYSVVYSVVSNNIALF